MSPQQHPQKGPGESVEARFSELVRAKRAGEAAQLLELHFGDGLRKRLSQLALGLGGGDESEHLAGWAVSLAVTRGADFDPNRGRLGTWLGSMARNLALSQLRKLRPETGLPSELAASARTVESRMHNREAFLLVWRRIGSAELRQVLFLDLKHHGQAPGAMARELGLDRAAFYKRRCEARRVFREIWTEEFGDPGNSFYGELE